jgi:hypothetical protein
METGIEKQEPIKLPTVAELFEDSGNIVVAGKAEELNAILNTPPPKNWVKEHPYIKDHKYLPIDKVEHLLRKIFKKYQIEITGQGTAFNGVWVTVRVHYFNPALNAMQYQDGIGAAQLQTAKGTSPSDLININNGALSMAFPIAKSLAVKDACDLIGAIFGANLNRRDVAVFKVDEQVIANYKKAVHEDN